MDSPPAAAEAEQHVQAEQQPEERTALATLVDAATQGDLPKLFIVAQTVESVDQADEQGRHAILEAAGAGSDNALRLLVNALKADVNLKNECNQTAMHFAASQGHSTTIRALFELGGDPDSPSIDQETPLMMAAFGGHREAVVQLARLGVQLDRQTPRKGHNG